MEILDLGIPSLKGQTKHDYSRKYCIDKEQLPKIVSCISISCTMFLWNWLWKKKKSYVW